ncbi:MAG: hypothetical protein R3C20_10350 [Planctomycetaceae bacterium]
MVRFVKTTVLAMAFFVAMGGLPFATSSANACPSCKAANESDSRLPQAYMYSILFMLAMPATVFAGFGISFYRLTRKARIQNEQLEAASDAKVGEQGTGTLLPTV